ncbi:hypothetical protein J0871_16750 [Salegentibacter sp. BDJ18]|uniref:hypothetical protein n=1 Tax=Salegentibacter sp. BDJ18 TaxID=2816376 RepID=UPI001AAE3B2D|nr:hypothetical protein [Salegentibacter sp. BDJ18]MBO2546068.1 hypothetical protein [Salegentibacter sp. BDJ18]
MDVQESKRGVCNRHGIRIYPVMNKDWGQYYIEIEYNRSPNWERRYIIKISRGKTAYNAKKKLWIERIEELYQELYETKVKPKLKKKKNEHEPSQ